VLAQVLGEGIPGPPSNALHSLKWEAPQEVLEGGADANAVAVFDRATCILQRSLQAGKKDGFGEGSVGTIVPVGEKVASKWGLVELRWLVRAASGSAGPSCRAQKTVSPPFSFGTTLVCGMWKVVTTLPLLSTMLRWRSETLMCTSR
jgi:hypothetical protein